MIHITTQGKIPKDGYTGSCILCRCKVQASVDSSYPVHNDQPYHKRYIKCPTLDCPNDIELNDGYNRLLWKVNNENN